MVVIESFFLIEFDHLARFARLFPEGCDLLLAAVDPNNLVGLGELRAFVDEIENLLVLRQCLCPCHKKIPPNYLRAESPFLSLYIITQKSVNVNQREKNFSEIFFTTKKAPPCSFYGGAYNKSQLNLSSTASGSRINVTVMSARRRTSGGVSPLLDPPKRSQAQKPTVKDAAASSATILFITLFMSVNILLA